MNNDIRISTAFPYNAKRLRLEKEGGPPAVLALVDLWCYAGRERADGRLTNMDAIDIAAAAGWSGAPDDLISMLVRGRLLDEVNGEYEIHDWRERNPYAATAPHRSRIARLNAHKRFCPARTGARHSCSEPDCENFARGESEQADVGRPPNRSPHGPIVASCNAESSQSHATGKQLPLNGIAPSPSPSPTPSTSSTSASSPALTATPFEGEIETRDSAGTAQSRRKNTEFDDDSREMKAAAYMLGKIHEKKPDFKAPNIQTWIKVFDAIFRIDKRHPDTVRHVIDFATGDSFWQSVVLSPKKLREKFDQLEIKMKSRPGTMARERRVEGVKGVAL